MTIAERGRYAGCSEEQNDPRDISNSDRRNVTSVIDFQLQSQMQKAAVCIRFY